MYSLKDARVRLPEMGRFAAQTAISSAVTYAASVGCLFAISGFLMLRSRHPLSCWAGPIETKQILDGGALLAVIVVIARSMVRLKPERLVGALLIIVCTMLSACAGPHASGTYETSASYGRLYSAALRAVPSIGYTVVSSNRADGVIVAKQAVFGGEGTEVGLNSVISQDGGKRTLQVDMVSPPGTMAFGDFSQNLKEYVDSVKASVPDLTSRP